MRVGIRRTVLTMAAAGMLSATVLSTAGCGAFFVCQKASCPSTGTVTTVNSGDYVYVSNVSGYSSSYLGAYSLASGTLTPIAGQPFPLDYEPIALVVSPNNGFLYAATATGTTTSPQGIYAYSINSSGVLSILNNGAPIIPNVTIASMDISPDGDWLFTIDATGDILSEYELSSTSGLATTNAQTFTTPGSTSGCVLGTASSTVPATQTCTVKASPNGNYVAVALGSSGTVVFPYGSSGGIGSNAYVSITPPTTVSGDYSLAFDLNNFLYVASTLELSSYGNVGNKSYSNPSNISMPEYASGTTPRAVTMSHSYNYVFTANEGASTISTFSLSTTGTLTEVGTTNTSAPTNVSALGADNTGTYLVTAGYDTTGGLQVFTISSTGVLTSSTATIGTGTNTAVPIVMALTH